MSRLWQKTTRVLLVEDDRATARLIQARLEMEGLIVLHANNGIEGLGILENTEIDLIVTDLMMPAMNGFRMIQEIRDMPAPKGVVPIIMISCNQNEADMTRCLAAGADDYIVKPLSVQMLVERLWRMNQRVTQMGGR